jgi:hypothetical protein
VIVNAKITLTETNTKVVHTKLTNAAGVYEFPERQATLDQIAPIETLGGINTGNPWFSTASFAKAATNVQGSTGRNIWSGPNLYSLNAGLSRWNVLREQMKLQLRFETLNTTNTPQFGLPNAGFGSNFGFVTSTISSGTGVNGTGGGRVVQLGAKVIF